jgi:hypothetical protein
MKRSLLLVPLVFVASLYGCESSSVTPSDDAGAADGGEAPVPSKCATPSGPAVEHGKAIEADETWGAGFHDVTFNFTIQKGATLTLAPCAVVRVKKGYSINVGNTDAANEGSLVAKGRADEPIVIEGLDGASWGNVLVWPFGHADLAYVTIRGGGNEGSRGGAAVHLFGDANKGFQDLATVDHVTIEKSGKYGLVMETHAGLSPASKDLTIRGSGVMAMNVGLPSVSSIPTGKYTGNAADAIRLTGSAVYDIQTTDQTIHDRGVPYVVGGEGQFGTITIEGTAALATLTVEAGVTLKFPKAATSYVTVSSGTSNTAAKGALKVLGTAAKPVTFTSAEAVPAKGDWAGIIFGNLPDGSNAIDYARIEYAGADTTVRGFSCGTPGLDGAEEISNEGAVLILGQPKSAFIRNTVFAHSLKNAVERGWTLGQSFDFLPTNTFEDIAHCKQTNPRPANNSCPSPTTCDK